MEKTEKEVIKELIIDHMKIIKGLASLLGSDVDYMAMCFIEKTSDEEKDFYSFNATSNHETVLNFNEFI